MSAGAASCRAAGTAVVAWVMTLSLRANAQNCASSNPADWPPAARPYFMMVVDSSGSMNQYIGPGTYPSCASYPDTRIGHAKCAVRKTVVSFSEANFGLAQFATTMTNCQSSCYVGCSPTIFQEELSYHRHYPGNDWRLSCGPTNGTATPPGSPSMLPYVARGANVLVPMAQDNGTSPGNVGAILQYLDNNCTNNLEVVNSPAAGPQLGLTPLNGVLRDMYRYFRSSWTRPDNGPTYNTPLSASDPACRSVNVILLTDGDETCDSQSDAVSAATALWTTGVTVGGKTFHVPVYVINFIGGNQANTDAIALAGGTTKSYLASDEAQLSTALANIVGGAIKPEVCDNVDNNCNGCVDEGYAHYCHRNKTPSANPSNDSQCCSEARASCLSQYQATQQKWWLPCWTPSDSGQPLSDTASWICVDPGDRCDDADNNCDGTNPNSSQVDEGQLKCNGHCPKTEECNGQDDDCDGVVDEKAGSNIPYSIDGCLKCDKTSEICDGCDNDCDGIADNNVVPIPCGLSTPDNCPGQMKCQPSQAVGHAGACIGTGPTNRWDQCDNQPQSEVCDNKDNDCDGTIDEDVPPTSCEIPGHSGLVYSDTFAPSQCQKGQQPCNGSCAGWAGPSQEICDGLDNDCDGKVDAADPDLLGVGQVCGSSQGTCAKGQTACLNGSLVCNSPSTPQPEICDGLDNDCNGYPDDGALQDAPVDADKPCWSVPAGTCDPSCSYTGSHNTVTWCPPTGGACHGPGTLASPPCALGMLVCQSGGWKCLGGTLPVPEACDGVDNNCDNQVDNGLPQLPCGIDKGECKPGTQKCLGGVVTCEDAIEPTKEICDNKDNDCDGDTDNGIAIGTSCSPDYDKQTYPGLRDKGECKPGVTECGPQGQAVCRDGVGPSPEVCDGLDNDCDNLVDEVGNGPDGINGTTNPKDGTQTIGATCGEKQGACEPGTWACVGGQFVCVGGVQPQKETCDCIDNDCDGETDEEPTSGSDPALCSSNKVCVAYEGGCQCAAPCSGGEFPCPTGGYSCKSVDQSGKDPVVSAGKRCVTEPCSDCRGQNAVANGKVECAPEGTVLDGGVRPPECVCRGQAGCQKPCFGVGCGVEKTVCTDYGPNAGRCVADSCWNIPCPMGQACNHGACVKNPCDPSPCAADWACKPSEDFSSAVCKGSCAGKSCSSAERCEDAKCVATGCTQTCKSGQVCAGADAGGCIKSKCEPNPCSDGSWCDPLTGSCGNDPCTGVICPKGQICNLGECVEAPLLDAGRDAQGTGGHGGGALEAGLGGMGASAGVEQPEEEPRGRFGLATGGGGCACETNAKQRNSVGLVSFLVGLGLAWRRRRRCAGDSSKAAQEATQVELRGGRP